MSGKNLGKVREFEVDYKWQLGSKSLVKASLSKIKSAKMFY